MDNRHRNNEAPSCAALPPSRRIVLMACALAAFGSVRAQAPAGKPAPVQLPGPRNGFEALVGNWVRDDGGYVISIRAIGADGALEAGYFNPRPLPFATANASRDGGIVRARFVLVAGGYDGSSYELAYDAASDRLVGVYHQAVMKQKFDVVFSRR